MGAQSFTPSFADPHGEPGGSPLSPPLEPELLEEPVVLPPELLLDVEPIPQGRVLPESAEHVLFSRHVACSSLGAFAQRLSQIAGGSSALHSVAFASQRLWQLAAAVVVVPPPPLEPPPLDAAWPLDPVVLEEQPTANTQRNPASRRWCMVVKSPFFTS